MTTPSIFELIGQYKRALQQTPQIPPLDSQITREVLRKVTLKGYNLCCGFQNGTQICITVDPEKPDITTLNLSECDEILRFVTSANFTSEGNTLTFS